MSWYNWPRRATWRSRLRDHSMYALMLAFTPYAYMTLFLARVPGALRDAWRDTRSDLDEEVYLSFLAIREAKKLGYFLPRQK